MATGVGVRLDRFLQIGRDDQCLYVFRRVPRTRGLCRLDDGRPAGVINPAASSRLTRVLFNADHALFGFRGVNICM